MFDSLPAPVLSDSDPQGRIAFGAFEILPGARALLRHGVGVPIGGRAFDMLLTLARAPGRIVGKDELMRQVWPAMIVEEANVRAQLRYLRQALGAECWRVKTIPGRGYLLNLADAPTGVPAAEEDENPPTATRAPVVVIAASAGRAEALRGIFAPAADLADTAGWAPIRIVAAAGGQPRFAALAARLEAAADGSDASDLDMMAERFDGAPGFSAMVMVWRADSGVAQSAA